MQERPEHPDAILVELEDNGAIGMTVMGPYKILNPDDKGYQEAKKRQEEDAKKRL
jgi:hypothetical protein